jgi:hypothetical protein
VPAKPVTADRRVCWPPCAAKAHHHIYQASCHLPQRHAGIAGERNSQLEDEWGERDDSERGCVTRWSTKTLVTLRYMHAYMAVCPLKRSFAFYNSR